VTVKGTFPAKKEFFPKTLRSGDRGRRVLRSGSSEGRGRRHSARRWGARLRGPEGPWRGTERAKRGRRERRRDPPGTTAIGMGTMKARCTCVRFHREVHSALWKNPGRGLDGFLLSGVDLDVRRSLFKMRPHAGGFRHVRTRPVFLCVGNSIRVTVYLIQLLSVFFKKGTIFFSIRAR